MEEEDELGKMEALMNVYEEVSGGSSSRDFRRELDKLVTPSRVFKKTLPVGLKRSPLSSSSMVDARGYFFNDLIILANPVKKGEDPHDVGSTLEDDEKGKRHTLQRFLAKYEVLLWLSLDRVSHVQPSPNSDIALQITFVKRMKDEKKVSKNGTAPIMTLVEKLEIWFDSAELAVEMYSRISRWVNHLIDLEMIRHANGGISDTGSHYSGESGGRQSQVSSKTDDSETRGWAKNKNTMKRNGTLRSHKGTWGSLRKEMGKSDAEETESIGGLSLDDLAKRYQKQLNFSAPPSDAGVKYEVSYPEGQMGIKLTSGPTVGVIVGSVMEDSYSEASGVAVGDRLVRIGEKEIPLDMSWQDARDLIIAAKRPLTMAFERIPDRAVIGDDDDDDDSKSAKVKSSSKGANKAKKPERERRAWATKRAQRFNQTSNLDSDERPISIKELENVYRAGKGSENVETGEAISELFRILRGKDSGESYQQAVLRLEEIWMTERSYVLDLRSLIRDFIMPLRLKKSRRKCREVKGSRVCEHNKLRSQCSREMENADALISNADLQAIFGNVESLVKINSELLNNMESQLLKMADPKVRNTITIADLVAMYAPAFKKIMPFVKLYSIYCLSYPSAIDRLLILRTSNTALNTAIEERESKSSTQLTSLLIRPVQRVTRYPLMFQDLLKYMDRLDQNGIEDHMNLLKDALAAVEKVANEVNNIVGAQEDRETLFDVYNELGGENTVNWLIEPSRKFITKVNVLLMEPPYEQNSEGKLHVLYLCTDILLIGKPAGSGLRFGSLKKTGGKGGASRPVSLRKTFGNSLKKVGSRHSLSRSSNSRHKSGTRTTPALVKLVRTIELKSLKTSSMSAPDKDGFYGIEITYSERMLDTGKAGRSGKQVTNINKARIWLPTKEEREALEEDLTNAVASLKRAQENHQKAQQTLGRKTARDWRSGNLHSKK